MTTITHDLGHGMGSDWENKDWAHITVPELHRLQLHYPCLQGVTFKFCGVVRVHFLQRYWLKLRRFASSTGKIGTSLVFH